jgi:hypothetical protein
MTFLNGILVAQETRARIDKWDFIKTKNLLESKRNSQQREEIAYRIGEYLCKIFI